MVPLRTAISTSSESWASTSNGLGRRIPRELPIRTNRAFIQSRNYKVITTQNAGQVLMVVVSLRESGLVCNQMELLLRFGSHSDHAPICEVSYS
jgi:hypothetical protein